MKDSTVKTEELFSAFAAFTQASEKLSKTYQTLGRQIDMLASGENTPASHKQEKDQRVASVPDVIDASEVLHEMPCALLIVGRSGVVSYSNSACNKILGNNPAGKKWSEIIEHELSGNQVGDEVKLKNGKVVSLGFMPGKERSGQIIVMKEVTGNRELYELLHKKSRAETVAEISGMIAHQIRTPLSAISIYLSRLDDSGKENINEVKEKISSNIRHLGKLVEEMIGFAKGEFGENRRSDEAGELVSSAVELVQDKAASCCVDIKFSSSVKAFVEVDREVFISSVANILNNSIEACIEKGCKGEISIDIRPGKLLPEGKYVEIVIRDNGAGVSGDDLAKVMDPLFTTKNKGTGIGLSVAKSAINSYGGALEFDAIEGEGAEVKITLENRMEQGGDEHA